MKNIIWRILLIISTIFSFGIASDNPKAMIIFDASGSMWGQINGKPKISIAKDALKSVVKNWNPNIELGLMVYGHRSKGDCNDIQTIIPIGKVDRNRVIKSVMAISPKGKTPISRSIKKAANELKYTEEKATIILISDGKETCDPDPCITAKQLKKEGIDFVAHVIGFNVDKNTDKQLECIANATGGEYFSAKNASALNKAIKSVVKKVEVIKPKLVPKVKVKKLDHNIEVTASESDGGKWINANCRAYNEDKSDSWGIYPRKKKAGVRQIPVGKYTLNCDYNAFKKKDIPFEVKAGEVTKLHVVFVSFVIKTLCEGKVNYEIYASNGQLVFEKSGVACNKPLKVTLNSGDYSISVMHNGTTKEKKFKINGDSNSLTIDLTIKEPSKEDLIKADSQSNSEVKESNKELKIPKDVAKKVDDINKKAKKAKELINAMGTLLNGVNQSSENGEDNLSVDDIKLFSK